MRTLNQRNVALKHYRFDLMAFYGGFFVVVSKNLQVEQDQVFCMYYDSLSIVCVCFLTKKKEKSGLGE